jgi:FRG domain
MTTSEQAIPDQSPLFQERHASSWKEVKRILEEYSPHYIFRGQAHADWLLCTSLERCSFFAKSYHIERDLVQDFQRAAVSYPEIVHHQPATDDYLSWLALMQHYGAPTRLLDFTYSPFIAAYFALEHAAQDCAVWAVEKDHLKEDLHHKWKFEFHEDIMFDLKPEIFKAIFEENKLQSVFPVRPPLSSKRYMLQQSIFVSLGNTNETFMKQLAAYQYPEYLKENVHKIIIPAEAIDHGLYDLERMNINRSTLFGDLEGYTSYLKRTYQLLYDGVPREVWQSANPSRTKRRLDKTARTV